MPGKSRKSSSFVPDASPGAFPSTLELGRALVVELGLDKSVDTLGRWMAHYVAELIDAAHRAAPNDRAEAERRCASAILELWRHRAGLSGGRLMMDLAPFVEVLNRIDPTTPQAIYFRSTWQHLDQDAREGTMSGSARSWLKTAEQADRGVREVIVFALGKAAEEEADRAKPWIELAKEARADGSPDIQLIRRLIVITAHGEPANSAAVRDLEDKLDRLTKLRHAMERVETEWRSQLHKLAAAGAPSSEIEQ